MPYSLIEEKLDILARKFTCVWHDLRCFLVLDALRYTHDGQAVPTEFLAGPRHSLRRAESGDRLRLRASTSESSTLAVPSEAETSARGAATDVRHQ